MKKIVVVGNGHISISDEDSFINNHTGKFLLELKNDFDEVYYCEFGRQGYDINNNLQNFALKKNKIPLIVINSKNKIVKIFSVLKIFYNNRDATLFHIFFPGSLGMMIAVLSIIFNKNYSIYFRSELNLSNKINKLILKKAKFIITVTSGFNDRLKNINENTHRIKPMIFIEKNDLYFNRKFNKNKKIKFLFVGRVEKAKGIYEIIKFCTFLDNDKLDYSFYLIGGGDIINELKTQQKQGEISSNIIFKGMISDKQALISMYRESDIFIFPSHFEGFPRVLYEAMSQQLPIITTMVGGIPDIMKDYENCLAIEPRNPKMLYEKVKLLINDIKLRKKIAGNALKDIQLIFDKNLLPHEEIIIQALK